MNNINEMSKDNNIHVRRIKIGRIPDTTTKPREELLVTPQKGLNYLESKKDFLSQAYYKHCT